LLNDQRRRFISSPDIVLQPNSIESVQKIMRFCFENRIRITPQGGNTGLCGATVTTEGVLLNLSKLNRIRDINLADNSMTVEAGVILQNAQKAAAEAGRLFPLSLASEGSCQIGGNIACNAGGLNVLRYGRFGSRFTKRRTGFPPSAPAQKHDRLRFAPSFYRQRRNIGHHYRRHTQTLCPAQNQSDSMGRFRRY